jgi:formamidopyrimidine-DNA glycosylase
MELGGTTIKSYTSSLGVTGRFQNELMVHKKEGEPCEICKSLIKKIKVNGRSTYYCENCQK